MKNFFFCLLAVASVAAVYFMWPRPKADLVQITGIKEFMDLNLVKYDSDRFLFGDDLKTWFFLCRKSDFELMVSNYNLLVFEDEALQKENSSEFYSLFQAAKRHLNVSVVPATAICLEHFESGVLFLYLPERELLIAELFYLKSKTAAELRKERQR